jgi:hypothetical protein
LPVEVAEARLHLRDGAMAGHVVIRGHGSAIRHPVSSVF